MSAPTSSHASLTVRIPCTEERDGVTYYGIAVHSENHHPIPTSDARPSCFRRYAEFAALHTALQTHHPAHVQCAFPPKAWFPRTARVVQARQTALASYLACVLQDPFVRQTPMVRAFLGLQQPPHTETAGGTAPVVTPLAWLDRYRDVHQALRHWKQKLHQCDADTTLQGMRDQQQTYANIQREWARVAHLETELESLTTLTPMEKTRRLNLLTNLRHEFQDALSGPVRASPALAPTSTGTPMTLQDQRRQISLQDQTAEDLAKVLQRHRVLAQEMHETLQEHNTRLDEMRSGFTSVATKVDVASKNTMPFT